MRRRACRQPRGRDAAQPSRLAAGDLQARLSRAPALTVRIVAYAGKTRQATHRTPRLRKIPLLLRTLMVTVTFQWTPHGRNDPVASRTQAQRRDKTAGGSPVLGDCSRWGGSRSGAGAEILIGRSEPVPHLRALTAPAARRAALSDSRSGSEPIAHRRALTALASRCAAITTFDARA